MVLCVVIDLIHSCINESEAVRDRQTSFQWVGLFLDCSADETLRNISRTKIPDSISCGK